MVDDEPNRASRSSGPKTGLGQEIYRAEVAGAITSLFVVTKPFGGTDADGIAFAIFVSHQKTIWPRPAALEKGSAGARYHAIAEEGVALKDIATAIGHGLHAPVISISREQAQEHFGFLGFFAGRDAHTSSAKTREQIGWNPCFQKTGIAFSNFLPAKAFRAPIHFIV
ncbi:Rossmann-fold NAD(P)-binding domain-containing protein [Acidicapsa acidisoli]|uniref:hypothetical protein n=1 Tax=Acidicapsa acidisoli TaxID=1615681 RepID=UPI0021E085E2|nr:hypothetical protein [Acidicapsa acidisoli]